MKGTIPTRLYALSHTVADWLRIVPLHYRSIPFLHMCHEATEPRSEAIRRLSFITSVFIKAELARLTDVEDLP
jgi:hypothetical protein